MGGEEGMVRLKAPRVLRRLSLGVEDVLNGSRYWF